jgi:hypothetical protein
LPCGGCGHDILQKPRESRGGLETTDISVSSICEIAPKITFTGKYKTLKQSIVAVEWVLTNKPRAVVNVLSFFALQSPSVND